MRVVKPMKLAVLHRPFERGGRFYLAVTVGVFFIFDQPDVLLSETTMWKFVAAELGKDAILDAGMPKQHGEVLVKGKCFVPGGNPAKGLEVRLKAGSIDKRLYVFGDRNWERKLGTWRISEPRPFAEMEVSWAKAFGGAGHAANPLGKGFQAADSSDRALRPLPNIENPARLITSPDDRPPPAGFEPVDLTWPQRFSKLGTYDDAWFKQRFPYPAADLDWTFHNTAANDQWLRGYFKGGEQVEIVGMHKNKPAVKTRLPNLVVRCFANQKVNNTVEFREFNTVAETLWLFPNSECGILLYRSVGEIATDDAFDVVNIVVGAEALDSPRDAKHYRTLVENRTNLSEAHKWLMRDDLLLPPERELRKGPGDEVDAMKALVSPKFVRHARMRANLEKKLEGTRKSVQQFAAIGDQPAPEMMKELAELEKKIAAAMTAIPADPTKIDFAELEKQADAARAQAQDLRASAEKNLRERFKEAGLDYEKLAAQKRLPGPPNPQMDVLQQFKRTRDELHTLGLKDAELNKLLDDPVLEKELSQRSEQLRDSYRRNAHHLPEPAQAPAELAAKLRADVAHAIERKESLAGRNLSGADLSRMSLRGVDMSGAYLEAANLTEADLAGANLSGAVLARATLRGTKLGGANLSKANLGKSDLNAAILTAANLTESILFEADLSNAKIAKAGVKNADLFHAKFAGADLSSIDLTGAQFLEANLDGTKFSDANLEKAVFLTCSLNKVDFSHAKMESAVLLQCNAESASFKGAHLRNLRMVQESAFPGADLSDSNLAEACLRGANLEAANFSRTNLEGADLSEANLRKANLSAVKARGLRLVRSDLSNANVAGSDLMDAVMQKALVPGASFSAANLYRCDVLKITVDAHSNFAKANLKRSLLRDWKPA
jgi:uncharacterized protein YjbI with pentapeptide repeats